MAGLSIVVLFGGDKGADAGKPCSGTLLPFVRMYSVDGGCSGTQRYDLYLPGIRY